MAYWLEMVKALRERAETAQFAHARGNREEVAEHLDGLLSLLPDLSEDLPDEDSPVAPDKYQSPLSPINGWMGDDELQWLYRLGTHFDRIVEVGSWCGRSTHAILSGNSYRRGRVWAVDHFQGSPSERDDVHARAKTVSIKSEFLANVGHFKNLRLLDVPSKQAALEFDADSIEVVFIDAGHDETSFREDIDAWMPKVKQGGILCGHDRNQDGVPKVLTSLSWNPKVTAGSLWAMVRKDGWTDWHEVYAKEGW